MKRILTIVLIAGLFVAIPCCGDYEAETGDDIQIRTDEKENTNPGDEDSDNEPANTEPTNTEPTNTEPTNTEPTNTEPTNTEPTNTEPTNTEPTNTEPADTEEDGPTEFEMSIIEELNLVRANPKSYAENYVAKYVNPFMDSGESFEEVRQNCINEMKQLSALSTFSYKKGLWKMAHDHVITQGPTGHTGHNRENGDSFQSALGKYAKSYNAAGENISYGPDTARGIVIQLLVDDDVPTRGHRRNILSSDFDQVGVAFGDHKNYRHMCVMDFAKGWVDKE